MSPPFVRRYLIVWGATLAATLGTVAAFNAVVDPFDVYRVVHPDPASTSASPR